jgi:hypothetical protein
MQPEMAADALKHDGVRLDTVVALVEALAKADSKGDPDLLICPS